jgi:hypothetical protein
MGRMNGEDFIFHRVTSAENYGSGKHTNVAGLAMLEGLRFSSIQLL